jgi:hypothetical protein
LGPFPPVRERERSAKKCRNGLLLEQSTGALFTPFWALTLLGPCSFKGLLIV